ncbi:MAG: ribose-phosphate pyrophosphokinase-like domain-containing protein, partial [Thermoplasmatales archaeon]|nr:ribose-phosphate pyrophosphokinase-like domain-containing protein [Thermoplasmatales archaeon]
MSKMYIIGGTASKNTAEDLSKELKVPIANTISKRFPDNEFYLRIMDDISGEHVVIVQTTYPDPNIIELFILQNAVEEAGAKKITVVIP